MEGTQVEKEKLISTNSNISNIITKVDETINVVPFNKFFVAILFK